MLLDSVPRKRRIWQINDLILMLVRAFAVAAVVLAFARPQVRSGILSGNSPGRDVIMVVDSSMSTARKNADKLVFDDIRAKALEVADRLNDSDKVRLMIAASVPHWVNVGSSPGSAASKNAVAEKIAELQPTLAAADLPNCVRSAIMSESPRDTTSRLVIVLTDGVANGWGADAGSRWQGIRASAERAAIPTAVNVVAADVPIDPIANLTIEKLATSRTRVAKGEPFTLSVQLRNAGDSLSQPTTLRWELDGEPAGESAVPSIEKGQSVDISYETACPATGAHAVACRILQEDDLPADNASTLVVEALEKLPVLICRSDAEPSSSAVNPDFLQAAMGRSHSAEETNRAASVFEPTVIPIEELVSTDLALYRCVILDNTLPNSSQATQILTDFVENGGGLWVILGDNIAAEQYNELLYRDGTGIAPVAVRDRATSGDQESDLFTVHPPEELHPATVLLGDTERLDIDDVRIKEHWSIATPDSLDNAAVLLERGDGSPLAAEQLVGRGRVIVLAVPCNTAWSNFPVCQTFVPLVQEWLWYLSEPTARQYNLDPGSPIVIDAAWVPDRTELSLATPLGITFEFETGSDAGKKDVRFRETAFPGEYMVKALAADKVEHRAPYAVRRDPRESRLAPLTSEQRERIAEAGGVSFNGDPLRLPEKSVEVVNQHPFWTYLAALVAALFFAEFIFSHVLTKNRYSEAAPPDGVQLASPQGYFDNRRILALPDAKARQRASQRETQSTNL